MSKRTPTDESSFSSIDEMDTPFHQFPTEKREAFVTRLNEDEELLEDTRAMDLYQLLLVLWDTRPGCILSTYSYAATKEAAEVQTYLPQEYRSIEPIEDLLTEFDIPYYRHVNLSDGSEPVQVSRNYYVSFDQQRREMIQDQLSKGSPYDSSSRKEDAVVGQFLGYPDEVIRAFCDSWDPGGETRFDQLSDEELLERLGPTRQFVEEREGESTEFVRFLLPYLVPATVENIDQRVVSDFEKFLSIGIIALAEYDIELIYHVLSHYQWFIRKAE